MAAKTSYSETSGKMKKRGIGAIKNKNVAQARFKDKGSEIASEQLVQLSKQLDSFKGFLEEFALKHRTDIKKNHEFRNQFQEMCASIGVDPLASGKGFWATLGVGDFYYELAVQIVEVCMSTNHRNGGLLSVKELQHRLNKSRGNHTEDITVSDILMATKKLKVLGGGFTVLPFGSSWLVQSVPGELNMDHTTVLQRAETKCFVTISELKNELKWEEERAKRALDDLVGEGLAWVDELNVQETHYWIPGIFSLQQIPLMEEG